MPRPSPLKSLLALCALGGLLASAGLGPGLEGVAHAEEAASAGGQMPAFSLRDMNGQEWNNTQLQNKLSLVNFWATWCQPCMVEMKHLERFHKAYADQGFQVVSVSIDDARSASMVKPIVKRNGYTFNVLLDKQTQLVSQVNPAKTLPYNMLVDGLTDPSKLTVVWTHLGYTPGDEKTMEEKIKTSLAGAAP